MSEIRTQGLELERESGPEAEVIDRGEAAVFVPPPNPRPLRVDIEEPTERHPSPGENRGAIVDRKEVREISGPPPGSSSPRPAPPLARVPRALGGTSRRWRPRCSPATHPLRRPIGVDRRAAR